MKLERIGIHNLPKRIHDEGGEWSIIGITLWGLHIIYAFIKFYFMYD